MIPEREREALMRLTMCAREECGMCKYKETCDFDFQYETATRCMNILADALNADRKTESNSEKPNNYCDDCLYTDTCDSKEFFYACTSKATISKMEQVDKDINVRSKDERQTDTEIAKAIVHKMIDDAVIAEDAYPDLRQKMHDAVDEYEPQTENLFTDKYGDVWEWRGDAWYCISGQDEPQIHGIFRKGELSDEEVEELKRQVDLILEYAEKKKSQTDCPWK